MSRTVGYARELLTGYDVDAESAALRAAGASEVFVDRAGASPRNELKRCLEALGTDDTLIVPSVVAITTSVEHFVATAAQLRQRGIHLRSLTEPALSTAPPQADVLDALDGVRRRLIGLRTREGLDAAASAGRRPGRPRVMTDERFEVARQLRAQNVSFAKIGRALGVSEAAVRRALKPADQDQGKTA